MEFKVDQYAIRVDINPQLAHGQFTCGRGYKIHSIYKIDLAFYKDDLGKINGWGARYFEPLNNPTELEKLIYSVDD